MYRITLNLAKKLSRRNKHLYWHRLNSIYHWGSKLHLLIVHVAVNFITGIMYILPYIPHLNQQCGHNVFSIIGGKNLSAREKYVYYYDPHPFPLFLKKNCIHKSSYIVKRNSSKVCMLAYHLIKIQRFLYISSSLMWSLLKELLPFLSLI